MVFSGCEALDPPLHRQKLVWLTKSEQTPERMVRVRKLPARFSIVPTPPPAQYVHRGT